MNRDKSLIPRLELTQLQRAGLWGALGLACLTLSACSGSEVDSDSKGTTIGAVSYFPNGTRAYTVKPSIKKENAIGVSERCQDFDTLETIYIDDTGRLAGITVQEEPLKCADGRLTPEDFVNTPASPTAVPSATAK